MSTDFFRLDKLVSFGLKIDEKFGLSSVLGVTAQQRHMEILGAWLISCAWTKPVTVIRENKLRKKKQITSNI